MPAGGARSSLLSVARHPSTSPRWAAASCIAVLLLSAAVIVSLWNRIEVYNAGYAAATPGVSATVVRSEHFTKGPDVIEVEWRDRNGELRRHEFDVDEAGDFPVGSTLPIRVSATVPDQIYPEDRTSIDETALPISGLVVLVVASLGAPVLWIRRAVQWRRAVRAPAKRHRAQLWYSYGRGNVIGIPWLAIVDGDRTYYQRLMWEPWVPSIAEDLVIEGRRVGRGPFVVDVPGFGRLWPAGPAKRREPRLESLVARHSSRYRLSRFSTLIVFSPLIVLMTGVLAGWLGGLTFAGHLWLLILYFGGAPTPVPLLRPRRYRRKTG
ncbi:hypothetical protein [Dactylosporangium sp. NPDC048998]|uniref:hypothetical protein n=1 Tax=Dactylosporangium sp. NPDC048998 TaxID=3363976 RepID=UPI003720D312